VAIFYANYSEGHVNEWLSLSDEGYLIRISLWMVYLYMSKTNLDYGQRQQTIWINAYRGGMKQLQNILICEDNLADKMHYPTVYCLLKIYQLVC